MTREPPRRTRIKICGITTPEMALVAADTGADYIGLVFRAGTPRQITDFALVDEILAALPAATEAVGVFVDRLEEPNADLDRWLARGKWCQLHGEVDEDALHKLAATHRIIRGFHFNADELLRWDACEDIAFLLTDGPRAGSGQAFDHTQLAALMPRITRPVFLAGGLAPGKEGPGNVTAAIHAVHPYAVDVSTGVESAPGIKDPTLIQAFCQAVRSADANTPSS